MEWDSTLGIWKDNKARSTTSLPSPLYIFGYGSLLWRPGEILEKYHSYPCLCYGWKRLFAQRSMDHRGTVQFPGYVATLVSNEYLQSYQKLLNHNENETESGKDTKNKDNHYNNDNINTT